MTRLLYSGFLAAALLMGPLPASADDGEAVPPELVDWYEQTNAAMVAHAHALAGQGDGRSKLAAVHLLVIPTQAKEGGEPDEALVQLRDRWFAEAAAELPDDPLMAWIQVGGWPLTSRETHERERERGMERLVRVAGDRAVPHLMLAQHAGESGNAEAERAHFDAAADAERFGIFFQEHMAFIFTAFEGLELPPTTERQRALLAEQLDLQPDPTPRQIASIWAGLHIFLPTFPAFLYPLEQCGLSGGGGERTQERHAACLRLFGRMAEDSRTVMEDLIALPAMVQLTVDTEEASAWRERLRGFTWLYEQYMEASMTGRTDNAAFSEDLAARGEKEGMRRQLAALGIDDTPPDGWLPENADRRHLIEHGQRLPR